MTAAPTTRTKFAFVGGHFTSTVLPIDPPAPGEVVVRVAGAALGTDPEAEISGEVVGTGEAAEEWLGRRVVVPRVLPCGECARCRRGHPAVCEGRKQRSGLATHETVAAKFLCSVEPPLWPEGEPLHRLAALADAAGAGYAAMVRAGLAPNESCVVVGNGPRARFLHAVARIKGAHPLSVGLEAGAERAVAEIEKSETATSFRLKIFETTGTTTGRAIALGCAAPGATVVLLERPLFQADEGPTERLPDLARLAEEEIQLIGSGACHPDLMPELCALVTRGELRLELLVRAIRSDQPFDPGDGSELLILTP